MASLCGRLVSNVLRSQIRAMPMVRYTSSKMPTALDHATGLEKKEMLATLAGIDDPYHNKPIRRGPSTKENPTLVPSAFDARIIGCICNDDQCHVIWMWLHKDVPKRCECGHWFKLYEVEPFIDADILALSNVH